MPTRPPRLCSTPGCGERAVRQGRCRDHQRQAYRRIERWRGTRQQRGYDEDWQRVRAQVLADEPTCRLCRTQGHTTLAREVDHIVPLAQGGPRLDRANLQPLCRECHGQKTAREHRERER